jgi:RNA polymerase sigma-70 factor (ECF subfamily)
MDVVQDSFVKAFASLDKLSDDTRFKSWFLRIVNNKALDLLRSKKVRRAMSLEAGDEDRGSFEVVDEQANDPGSNLSGSDTQRRIREAIASLPSEQQAVITLYATASLTYGEIAETLDIPLGTVMSRIHRARKLLAQWLPDLISVEDNDGKGNGPRSGSATKEQAG